MRGSIKKFLTVLTLAAVIVCALPLSAFAYEREDHTELALEAVTEGMVLLKNNDAALPLGKNDKVALFGEGQLYVDGLTEGYMIGGGGSGWVNLSYTPQSPADALIAGGLEVYDDLTNAYKSDVDYVPDANMYGNAAEYADTAIMFITRYSAENSDIEEDEWYLSDDERTMLKTLSEKFEKVVVLLNIPSVISTEWSLDGSLYDGADDGIDVDALLICYMGGEMSAQGIADILLGKVSPSGKLTDTYAADLYDYPTTNTFLESDGYVNYTEDIYVGYRYFETFAKDKVVYPFGFGLSYTDFSISTESFTYDSKNISVTVTVKNIGSVAGKEVVQVYYSAPQMGTGQAVLSKSSVTLADYAKTELLQPGQSQTLTLTYAIDDMSSFDDTGKTGNSSCYVLEVGTYSVYVGNSVRNTELAGTYNVNALTITDRLSSLLATNLDERLTADGTYETLPTNGTNAMGAARSVSNDDESDIEIDFQADNYVGITYADVLNGQASLEELVAQMSYAELIDLCYGHAAGLSTGTGTIGFSSNATAEKYGIYSANTADGPAGLRLSSGAYVPTFFPCATLQASTWNTELIEEIGKAIGDECIRYNADIWLAPGLNIHRNPLCGRNFEYYSEDPVVSGKSASAVVNGVRSRGVGCAIKHFVANNKENSRKYSDSRVSEKALRELYLKGFQIAINNSDPTCVMTSYNMLNGTYTSVNSELIKGILRDEWGYDGLVISDWDTIPRITDEIVVGNNVTMPTGEAVELENSVRNGTVTRHILEENATYIINTLVQLPNHTLHLNRVNEISDTELTTVGVKNFSIRSYMTRFELVNGEFCATNITDSNKTDGTYGFIEFNISVKTEGVYSIFIDYATPYDISDAYSISVNGNTVSEIDDSVTATAYKPDEGWRTFERKKLGDVFLPEGVSTIRIQHTSGTAANYRSLSFDLVSAGEPHVHNFGTWVSANDQQHRRICSCGSEEIEEHSWNEGVVTLEPTELDVGEKTYTCTVCQSKKTATIVPSPEPTDSNEGNDDLYGAAGVKIIAISVGATLAAEGLLFAVGYAIFKFMKKRKRID